MILFDTDHFTVLVNTSHSSYSRIATRLLASPDQDVKANAVSLEEQLRGWLSSINRSSDLHRQVFAYERLVELIEFYADWNILPFDANAAAIFSSLRSQKIRVGTQDLKIASIALANGALLITSNTNDFAKVPGLRFEDWMHS